MKKLLLMTTLFLSLHSELHKYLPYTFGVEFNPLRPLFSMMMDGPSFSASFNYFNHERNLEIAFPVTYNQGKVSRGDYGYTNREYNYDEIDANFGMHLRKYFTEEIRGVYVGAFGRYTYLKGKLRDDYRLASLHKLGLGAEVGFKIMNIGGSGIFWGASLGYGKYFGDKNGVFEAYYPAMYMDDWAYFFDVELLKIGYEFR